MVVLTDVTTPSTQFELGRATAGFDHLDVELDRVVPLDEDLIPYIWVRGEVESDEFERAVTSTDAVDNCQRLEKVGSRTLFRLEWASETGELLPQLIENNVTVLEGHGSDPWFFRLRFPDRNTLTTFYDTCQSAGMDIDIDRVYTLSEAVREDATPELTDEQYEILSLAFREGYYEVPRDATLGDLASALEISKQAASERLRRGMRTVLDRSL